MGPLGTSESSSTRRLPAEAAHQARRWLLNSKTPTATSLVTTEQIRLSLRHGKHANHAIPVTKPLVAPDAELPLAPYTLGVWLGDGRHGTPRSIRMTRRSPS